MLGALGGKKDLGSSIKYDAATDRYGVTLFKEKSYSVLGGKMVIPEARTVWVNGDWTESRDPQGSMVAMLYQKAYLDFVGIKSRGPNGELLENSRWQIPAKSDWQSFHRAFFSVTGKAPTWVNAAATDAANMQRQFEASGAMVASTKNNGLTTGVIANHSYTVVGVYRQNAKWYVRLYNPWGSDGASGSLFDRSGTGVKMNKDDGFISLTWDQFKVSFTGFSFV